MRNFDDLRPLIIFFLLTQLSFGQSATSIEMSDCGDTAPHVDSLRHALNLPTALQLQWVATRNGVDTLRIIDDFNRTEIGDHWALRQSGWEIYDGELRVVRGINCSWCFLAVFLPVFNSSEREIYSVSYRWGKDADAAGIGEGAHALMIDRPDTSGVGYWLWHRPSYHEVWLWELLPGTVNRAGRRQGVQIVRQNAPAANPVAGDVVTAMIRANSTFDYYVNHVLDARVQDPQRRFPRSDTSYVGVFMRGESVNNQIDDFTVTWLENDRVAPAQVKDLRPIDRSSSSITLRWTTPGDNSYEGDATSLELRYSQLPITAANFSSAALAANLPQPQPPCQQQDFTVAGLEIFTSYYFALRVADEVQNFSPLSNVVRIATAGDGVPDSLAVTSGCNPSARVGESVTVTAEVLDHLGAAVPGISLDFRIESGGGNLAGGDKLTVMTDFFGRARVVWNLGTIAGVNAVEIEALGLKGSPFRCSTTAHGGAPASLRLISGDLQVLSQEKISAAITVRVADAFDNALPDISMRFNLISGSGKLVSRDGALVDTIAARTDSAGQSSVNVKVESIPGDTTVAQAAVVDGSSSLISRFMVITAAPGELIQIAGDDQTARAGETLSEPLMVRIVDVLGAPIRNFPVRFQIQSGGGNLAGGVDRYEVATDDSGNARTTWTLGNVPGQQTVVAEARFQQHDIPASPLKFTAFATPTSTTLDHSTITATPANGAIADSQFAVLVVISLRDSDSHVVSGFPVEIAASGENNFITQPAIPTDSAGMAIATLRSTRAERKRITATIPTYGTAVPDTAVVQFVAGAPAQVRMQSGNAQRGFVNGVLPEPIAVKVSDRFGNPNEQVSVQFQPVAGEGAVIGPSRVPSDSHGVALVQWRLGPNAGLNRLLAIAEGLEGSPVEFIATALDSVKTAVSDGQRNPPSEFALLQNTPNPFNPETTIRFDLPEAAEVLMTLYDLNGRVVKTLIGGSLPAGNHRTYWDGRDQAGRRAESGIYLCRLDARVLHGSTRYSAVRKLILVK